MKTVHFVTTNKHKFNEVKDILSKFNINVKQLELEKIEPKDYTVEQVAKTAAETIANQVKMPIVLEDTGIFFEAYTNFPGPLPKFVFDNIGYKGILKLLDNESRNAYFKTITAYAEPGKQAVLFKGIMKGKLTEKVYNQDKDVMPYERIFIPESFNTTLSDMNREQKNNLSHRSKAFKKFGEWFIENA